MMIHRVLLCNYSVGLRGGSESEEERKCLPSDTLTIPLILATWPLINSPLVTSRTNLVSQRGAALNIIETMVRQHINPANSLSSYHILSFLSFAILLVIENIPKGTKFIQLFSQISNPPANSESLISISISISFWQFEK